MTQPLICSHHRRFVSGWHLFLWCQLLAQAWSSPRQCYAPSGARIFYYTRLHLVRARDIPTLEPTLQRLAPEVVAAFLRTAPAIAAHLATEYAQVVRIRTQPVVEGPRVLVTHPAPHFPGLPEMLTRLDACPETSSSDLLIQWDVCWKGLSSYFLPALVLLDDLHVRVAPIARPEDSPGVALRCLVDRLERDKREGIWLTPSPEAYLYDRPFLHWFAQGLLMQPWFRGVWQKQFTQTKDV